MRRLPPCRRWRRATVILTLAALAAAACSTSPDMALPEPTATPVATVGPSPTPAPSPTPIPDPPGRADLPDDLELEPGARIAIADAAGQITTVLGDGTNAVPLTAADEGTVNRFPTWSPDANRLAWVTTAPDGAAPEVRAARFDGTGWLQQEVPAGPFLLMWDPSASRVATLAPGRAGFELGVVDLAEAPTYTPIDEGAPFWFSWSPDADAFLVHASGLRLDVVPLDGAPQVLEPLPGSFQAPAWLPGPVPLVYADRVDDQDFLVVAGDLGSGRRALATFDGYLQFTVAADSGLIALQVLDESLAPVPETITASFQGDEIVDIIDTIPRDQLTVMATFGGDPIVLHPDPFGQVPDADARVVSFMWSPDGSQLAWLLEIEAGQGCETETAVYEWRFWTGSAITTGPRFVPTPTLACDYLPFFDQFEQAVTFWSPENDRIVYAGTDLRTGERGVFVHTIASTEASRRIGEGEIGIWSPDAAGSAGASAV